jgi:hypothetical protein
VCSSFTGDGGHHRRQGREEEKKLSKTHLFLEFFAAAHEPTRRQWRRLVGETRRHCFRDPKAFQHCSYGCTIPDSILGLFL